MAKNKIIPPLETVINSLYPESERGAVLIGTELIYEKVKELIAAKIEESNPSLFIQHRQDGILVETEHSSELKQYYKDLNFLGSASVAINIAWVFDFIDEYTYNNIKRVQYIRNKFAHNVEAISFDSTLNIRNKLEEALEDSYSVKLSTAEPNIILNRNTDKTYQDKFIRVVASLCLVLEREAKNQHRMSPTRKKPHYHVKDV